MNPLALVPLHVAYIQTFLPKIQLYNEARSLNIPTSNPNLPANGTQIQNINYHCQRKEKWHWNPMIYSRTPICTILREQLHIEVKLRKPKRSKRERKQSMVEVPHQTKLPTLIIGIVTISRSISIIRVSLLRQHGRRRDIQTQDDAVVLVKIAIN